MSKRSDVVVDGIRLSILSEGQGTQGLFLLHGIGFGADSFLRNMQPPAAQIRVVAVDLPGHGFSDAMDYGGKPPQLVMAGLINRLADLLGLKSWSVAGSSYGAIVASLAWFDRPAQVKSLILIGSGSVFHATEQQKKTLAASVANGRTAMIDPTLESCRKRAGNIVFDPAVVPAEMVKSQLESYRLPDRLAAYENTVNETVRTMEMPGARVLDRLEEMRVPTLVITGRNDIRSSWEKHVEGAARMPDAELNIYEDCGHIPYLEHADRFNADMADFLRRHPLG